MQHTQPLEPGHTYHIYTRGNNRDNIFFEERNYRYFLQLYAKHVLPVAETFAYCLMRNHFHFLVRIKTSRVSETREVSATRDQTSRVSKTREVSATREVLATRDVSQSFSNWLNAYAKAINKAYKRTGSLFEERFRRIEVTNDAYFKQLVFYIHFNPQKHRFVDDFREWQWSSYHAFQSQSVTHLARGEALGWFGDVTEFEKFHRGQVDEARIQALIEDDLA